MRGPDGLAGWEELADGVIVANQPHGAPSWFACNDRPSDKAAYRVTIACDAAYTVWGQWAPGCAGGRRAARPRGRGSSPADGPYLATPPDRSVCHCASSPTRRSRCAWSAGTVARPMDIAFADQVRMIEAMREWFRAVSLRGGPRSSRTTTRIPRESQTLSTFGANLMNRTREAQRLIAA